MSDNLFSEPIPQVAWYLQMIHKLKQSKKPMDKMPLVEIIKLYESGFVLCDSCGGKMKITECKFDLIEHLIHLVNPMALWSCEGCYLKSKRLGHIIAEVPQTG